MLRLLLMLALVFPYQTRGYADDMAERLPHPVHDLIEPIQGITATQVRKIILAKLGKHSRDIGSGITIYCWDFDSGELIEGAGIAKFFFKSGEVFWLNKTRSPVSKSVFNSYEMCSTDNQHWLGKIDLKVNGRYVLERCDDDEPGWFAGQEENFFLKNPRGTFKIEFLDDIKETTLLESLPPSHEMNLAKLVFISRNGKKRGFYIRSIQKYHGLEFFDGTALPFRMESSWQSDLPTN